MPLVRVELFERRLTPELESRLSPSLLALRTVKARRSSHTDLYVFTLQPLR